ncbi:phage tail tape measure protein [Paenibacillus sp. 11B]|uniref:phage tail tape measure protein n=1 Tax=unclassified Paenibacillus TaxID=185978 RepID=UPI00264B246C|nr:phage tail tape measure protein [Paenibacillus sp. 11B]MDN8592021.1 phage tail tape measure protein [Paenibacillus sp. 11B]
MATLTAMFDIRDRISSRVRQMRGNFNRLRDTVDQVRRRVERLSRTRAIIRTQLRDFASRGLNRIRDLRDYLNRQATVIRTIIRDRASRGLLRLRQLGRNIQARAVVITTRLRDMATRGLRRLSAQVPRISRLVAVIRTRLRDEASAGLVRIRATMAYLRWRRAVLRTQLRDMATRGLVRLRRLGDSLHRRTVLIGTKLRDMASRGLTRLQSMATALGGYTATVRTKLRDAALRGLTRLRSFARNLGRMRVTIQTRVRDTAIRGLNKVRALARRVGAITATVVVKVKDLATRAIARIESSLAGLQNKVLGIGAALGGTAILAQGANAFETDAKASAISGISQPQVTAMTDQIYYGENIGTERSGVAQSLVDFAQQTNLQGKALQEAARTSAMFAQLYGKDIPEVDRAFASAYKNQLGSMSEIGDVSAYVIKNAGDQYDDYLDTINEYSSTFKDLQLNMGQVGSAFVAAVQAGGRNFDEPADMFREFNIRRNELTDNQITAMAKVLGKSRTRELYKSMDAGTLSGEKVMFEFATALSKIPSEAQRALYATELLGTKYEDIKEPVLAAARAINEPIEASKELEKQFNTMRENNPMTAINDTTRKLGKTVKNIGQSVLTAVTPAFIELNKWASSPEGQKSIAKFTESVAELSGELANGLSKGIQWVVENWDTLLPILKVVGAAFLGVYGAAKGYQAVKVATPVFKGLWKVLKVVWSILKWVGSALLWLGKGFVKVLKWAKPFLPWIGRVIGGLVRFLPVIGWVVTALGVLWEAWKNWDKIKEVVANAFEGAKDIVARSVNAMIKSVNWLIEKLNGLGDVLGYNIPTIQLLETKATRETNKKAVSTLTGSGKTSDSPMMSGKAAPVSNFPNLIKGFTPKTIDEPSHAKGISNIPYDNYKANLHKGETVLPREEAELIRGMAASGGSQTASPVAAPISINITGDNHYSNDMDANKVVRVVKKALQDELNLGPQGVQFV